MATQAQTDFGGLAATRGVAGDYNGVATPEQATESGNYQKTNETIRKPFWLPPYNPPKVRVII